MTQTNLSPCLYHPTWVGQAICRTCLKRHDVLFSGLSAGELTEITTGVHEPIDEFSYEKGAVIYPQGGDDNAIHTLRSGSVKLVRYLPDGRERIIRLARVSDSIGLERVLGRPYGHTAIALQPVSACRIPLSVVRQLDVENPHFYRQLMERWAAALFQADDYIMMVLAGTVKQRVAHLLRWLSEDAEDARKPCIELLKGEDIAAMLDITAESVSRTLADLKRQGILRHREDGRFEYTEKALQEYAAAP